MRTYAVELGHLQLDLALTFGVARDIKEKVADPMLIGQEAALSERMARAGIAYKPKFEFTIDNIPLIIWLGCKVNHPELKLSEIQETCCDIGFVNAMGIADSFLAQFIAPRAQEKIDTKGDEKPGE